MYGVVKEAKKKGLLTLCHTNGGIAKVPLLELLKFMDGVTVDLKAFSQNFYREISGSKLEPVLETLKTIKGANKHLEIVNLVIPTLNDQMDDIKKMCRWILGNLGKDTPLHFTRFSPSYKMTHLPFTPINTLEEARSIAVGEGIEYVYINPRYLELMSTRLPVTPLQNLSYAGMIALPRWGLVRSENTHILIHSRYYRS
jgi:pyruvate formate lyase activating enzyme